MQSVSLLPPTNESSTITRDFTETKKHKSTAMFSQHLDGYLPVRIISRDRPTGEKDPRVIIAASGPLVYLDFPFVTRTALRGWADFSIYTRLDRDCNPFNAR